MYRLRQIIFDNIKSYDTLGLFLTSYEIGRPDVKKILIEIEGRDGALDYTEALGGVHYKNRKLNFNFVAKRGEVDYSSILNKLHGKLMDITLPDEAGFYYHGRVEVSAYKSERGVANISVEADCYPYKKKMQETVIQKNLSGAAIDIVCNNLKEPIIPVIETTATAVIKFQNKTFSVQAGKHMLDILFTQGSNILNVSGTGSIKITYREGSL